MKSIGSLLYKSLTQRPRQHDHGVAIVQHFGVHQPGEPLSQHPARLVDRPVERVHLERLDEMLRQVREHDDHEDSEGALVPRAVERDDERGRGNRACHGRSDRSTQFWRLYAVSATTTAGRAGVIIKE